VGSLILPHQLPRWGDRRFRCECDATFEDGGTAIEHTFSGHEVVRERYAGGMWLFDPRDIATLILERMMEQGEDIPAFVDRIKRRADAVEAQYNEFERNAQIADEQMREMARLHDPNPPGQRRVATFDLGGVAWQR